MRRPLSLLLWAFLFPILISAQGTTTSKILKAPLKGDVKLEQDGSFTYTPNASVLNDAALINAKAPFDSLTYEYCVGGNCSQATATFTLDKSSIDHSINKVFEPLTKVISDIVFFSIPYGSKTYEAKGDGYTVIAEEGRISANLAKNDSSQSEIPFVLIWLIVGAIFFTIYNGFINFTGFRHALDVVRGKYDAPHSAGEVSHFQALTAALSGTVGVGNIAGVAIAIALGGPGATFWMILAGLFGMSSKFVECTLGVKYRNENPDGSVSGGPMYYLSKGLAKKNQKGLGKFLAVLFAIACIGGSLGGGNMVQINQATQQLIAVTGGAASPLAGSGWIFGVIMAVLVGLVIVGGIKSIAKVTDKIVPFMVGVYVLGALVVLGYHFTDIPAAFGAIFAGAFSKTAAFGGFVGVLILGFRRAAFSNEAGIGSASIAHSAAKTDEPISEGIVALLEPFIDTVVVCTMTALVIIITNNAPEAAQELNGDAAIALTSRSFESVMSFFPVILSVAVILFALSTMISWSYYGLKAWTYLFGETKTADYSYKAVFCLFVIIGSAISAKSVFDFGDAMIFAMAFPNVLGLYFLAPEIRTDLKDYMARVKSGAIKRYK